MNWFEDIKRSTYVMKPLEMRAVQVDLCPKCHAKKSLIECYNDNGICSKQCSNCHVVFIFEEA